MFSPRHCGPTLPSQIEGLPAHYYPEPPDPKAIGELSAGVQAFLDAIPLRVVHGGDSAHYTPSTDTVTLPSPGAFHSIEAYFSTRCHEVCNIASVLISRTVDGLC
ncbi:zincin-like metallopeptidase domain-containing protein, partial [Novosphingobium sp. CCH12-A3]|uniref:zincin-like metallopeptidase domain-containing protein n=1 Tax=Novosphingobium sp. CCH12-A3 TaxID=1768752 RepID=UPI000A45CA1E